ncbi:hypothetical protein CSC14_4086 [Proteus mirabilis]|nr:hypothetical protein CSC16_1503 [Proteus mirabilis]PVF84618.1 hypothetical protein CSC14_4086 [Proteus mirabilis]
MNIKKNTAISIKNSAITSFILDSNKVVLADNINDQFTISVHYQ